MAHFDANQQVHNFDDNDPPPLPPQLRRTGDQLNSYTVHVYQDGQIVTSDQVLIIPESEETRQLHENQIILYNNNNYYWRNNDNAFTLIENILIGNYYRLLINDVMHIRQINNNVPLPQPLLQVPQPLVQVPGVGYKYLKYKKKYMKLKNQIL